jgi:hypothetical protein
MSTTDTPGGIPRSVTGRATAGQQQNRYLADELAKLDVISRKRPIRRGQPLGQLVKAPQQLPDPVGDVVPVSNHGAPSEERPPRSANRAAVRWSIDAISARSTGGGPVGDSNQSATSADGPTNDVSSAAA